MAKKSFCYSSFPDEESNSRHFHHVSESNLDLEFQDQDHPFEGAATAAASSSQSHRQAEKRRRDRINAQLTGLRRLIPKSEKMDKAILLERAVEQVKELKRKTSEINKLLFTIPTETDSVTIECHTNNAQQEASFPTILHDDRQQNHHKNKLMMIKATFCCEDRTDLIPELIKALKDLNLAITEAEIACLGGRMKSILLLYYKLDDDDNNNNNNNNNNGVCNNISGIKQSLMSVLNRVVTWSSASTTNFRVTSKRQRFFFSS